MNKYLFLAGLACFGAVLAAPAADPAPLQAKIADDKILITRKGSDSPLVVHNLKKDFRPYLHPLVASDGKGVLTEFSPSHHKHQTGLYWGFTRVNGRDYFHNPGGDYWQLADKKILVETGPAVKWQSVYDLLGADKKPALNETQTWTLTDHGTHYILDLEWRGKAITDVVFGKYEYGGLFLRMPWTSKTGGEAVNSEGEKGGASEGKRARWVDVGMPVEGRDDWAHIVMMDHPANDGHPLPWRVDGQLGVGPCRARLGDWKLPAGESAVIRHRFFVYTGKTDKDRVEQAWKAFAK